MTACCSFITLLGRIGLALLFLLSGINKFVEWDATSAYMASKGFTFVPFFLVGAALVEIVFSILLILGYKTRLAAAVLFLFLIPTSVIFHDFWHHEGLERHLQMLFFLRNVAIMGGLLYVISCGAGGFSFDRFCCHNGCNTSCKKDEPVRRDTSVRDEPIERIDTLRTDETHRPE